MSKIVNEGTFSSYTDIARMALVISIHGFTTFQEIISKTVRGTLALVLEIHEFTGTRGTRPNTAHAL